MIGYPIGARYIGSPNIMTSSANEEIIQQHSDPEWTTFKVYKLSFMNYQDCHIKINGSSAIFLKAN